jgi:hypothetical protein
MTDNEKRLEVTARMTAEQFSEGMKTTNEMTSSSPSGLNFTLWKAIAEDEGLADIPIHYTTDASTPSRRPGDAFCFFKASKPIKTS